MAKVKLVVTHPSYDDYDRGDIIEIEEKDVTPRMASLTKRYTAPVHKTVKVDVKAKAAELTKKDKEVEAKAAELDKKEAELKSKQDELDKKLAALEAAEAEASKK